MIKKEGKFPVNARVDVDYSRKEPKIKFGYTSKNPKKDAMKQHSFGMHTLLILVIFYIAFAYFISYDVIKEYPENCSVDFNKINETLDLSIDFDRGELYQTTIINRTYKKVITGANITCDGELYRVSWRKYTPIWELASPEDGFYHKYDGEGEWFPIIFLFSSMLIFFIVGYALNKFLTWLLLKSERYKKGFPKFQAKSIGSRRYRKFKVADVENNIVEIPCFSNVILDYKSDGDFSKQLIKIKIREHIYHRYNRKKKKPKKLKRDVYHWYARFFFKETPKDGYLEVIYH